MLRKKIDFFGAELTKEEANSYRAWLAQEEGRIHDRVVSALLNTAERNAMKDPVQGSDPHLFAMQREQYLGERKGLIKIKNMIQSLEGI